MPSMEKTKKLRAPKYLENPLSFLMYTKEKTWTSVPMNVTMSNISRLMGSFSVWISMAKDSWPTAVGNGESFSTKPMESQVNLGSLPTSVFSTP